jgi:hypothetical protein
MSPKLPLRRKPTKAEPYCVGNEEVGYLHLLKKGFVTVGERDVIGEFEIDRQQGLQAISRLLKKIAADRGITRQQARELLFPNRENQSALPVFVVCTAIASRFSLESVENLDSVNIGDYVSGRGIPKGTVVDGKDGNQIAISQHATESGLFKLSFSGINPDAETSDDILLEYPDEAEQLNKLGLATAKLKNFVTTLFIQERVLFPIELTQEAPINSTHLNIQPATAYLKDGYQVKFGNCIATVQGNHDLDAELIAVAPTSERLPAGAVGFLWFPEMKAYLRGMGDWTNEDTKNLDERLVDEIFDFYQNERSGWPNTAEAAEARGDNKGERTNHPQLEPEPQSTGVNSIGESNPTVLRIADLQIGAAS